mgnify:CR=1 FL=1
MFYFTFNLYENVPEIFLTIFFVQPLSGSLFNQIINMRNSKICSQYVDNENAIVIKVLTVKKRDNVTI